MTRRRGPPGRELAAARSTERRTRYGYGHLTRTEKRGPAVLAFLRIAEAWLGRRR